MRKHLLLYVFLLCSFGRFALAQEGGHIVSGHVKGSDGDEALIGVNVVEVDQDNRFVNGQITDINGFFMMKLSSPNSTLRFTYVGYKEKREKVNGRSKLQVTLSSAMEELQTVVVQGESTSDGFIEFRNKNTSMARVNIAEMDAMGAPSVDEMLQGRISSVDIVAASGDPGAGMQIRIRGTSTINGNREPLIVLDGIPFEADIDESFDFNSADQQNFSELLSIPVNDIETIEVLKDAASAAIWGAKAANGVIQITTKRGKRSKPYVTYAASYRIDTQPERIPLLSGSEYVTLQKDLLFNANGNPASSDRPELNYDRDFEHYYNYAQDVDWMDEITRTGQTQEHNVSLQGGGEKIRYRTSFNYRGQEGTVIGTGFDRITTRVNLDYFISDKLQVSSEFAYSRESTDSPYHNDGDKPLYYRTVAQAKMPNHSIYEYDEEGNLTGKYFTDTRLNAYQGTYNPVAMAREAGANALKNRLVSNLRIRYDLTETLSLKSTVSISLTNSKSSAFLPESASRYDWDGPEVNEARGTDAEGFRVNTFTDIFYTPKLGENHSLLFHGSWQTSDSRSYKYGISSSSLASGDFNEPGAAGYIRGMESSNGLGRTLGLVARTDYTYKNTYNVGGGFRMGADSGYGDSFSWGYFPYAAFFWRISNESFMEDLSFVDELKLRGNVGTVGLAPDRNKFSPHSIYGPSGTYMDMGGVVPRNIKLNNLKWSVKTTYDVGLEFSGFENRVNMEFGAYRSVTADQLLQLGVPGSTGYSNVFQNAATLTNEGVEFELSLVPYQTKDTKLTFDFNIARNINRVEKVPESFPLQGGNLRENGSYGVRLVEGHPLGGFYGYESLGVYSTKKDLIALDKNGEPIRDYETGEGLTMRTAWGYAFEAGDAKYKDQNNDGVIDEADVKYLGSSNPDFIGGFGLRLTHKGWSLNSRFVFRSGQDAVNSARMGLETMNNSNNQSTAVLRRWRRPGDVTDIPRAVHGGYATYNYLASDRFVEETSYLRFRSLSLAYRFDQKFVKKIGLSNLKITATANNLFTFTDYTGQDPEVPLGGGVFDIGYDKGFTPPSRSFIINLNASF
ncbi:SusC/RagA family TonB-linked outer membrane protein (plasmid) [Fulvitalea axinellae]|uniref:SusC/RagA family TonB-linked outer membrane protein n=1 Tax=Fulvitalea axinellae TaxID=1182444 RepID=A0AAU9CZL2_9BACT|nr:SusC/RagA family TonB-linked outer membrane protein [Fulvitalea axinellae]